MTSTDIANMALSRLGEPRISDIAGSGDVAISCRTHYETIRDALLRSHQWNFAVVGAELSTTDTPAFGWDYAFSLPADFLLLCTLNGVQAALLEAAHTVEGGNLLTDNDTARITYVQRVTDTNLFDPLFVECLSLRLASAIALDVTQDKGKRDAMEALATEAFSKATFADAGENRVHVVSPLTARGPIYTQNPYYDPYYDRLP